jgi:hypothetical protein
MKTALLLKRAPTLITMVCLTYACYSIHASTSGPATPAADLATGFEGLMSDVVKAGEAEVQVLENAMHRDPFSVVVPAVDPATAAATTDGGDDPDSLSLAGIVSGLTLDATFLQKDTQIAIVSGRMYHRGDYLVIKTDAGKAFSPLLVQNVQPHEVTLTARGKAYKLGYPDQLGSRPAVSKDPAPASTDGSIAEIDPEGELAFYKKLLNSPLGRMGKSLTGNIGPGAGRGDAKGRSRGARSRASTGGP